MVESGGSRVFDIADIESHDPQGVQHTNDEGWETALQENCGEQKPRAQACHPNWPGKARLAKAFWWLLARVAGWEDAAGRREFLRGDANSVGAMDISDAIHLLFHLFTGKFLLSCDDAGDINEDGTLDLSDVLSLLRHLFMEQGSIPGPFSACGPDPAGDDLTCRTFQPCE